MRNTKHQRLIVWLRRELRVQDNLALWMAVHDAREVVPLYIVDSRFDTLAPAKRKVILDALVDLRTSVRRLGGELFVRAGDPEKTLHQLIESTGAVGVYLTRDEDPGVLHNDENIKTSVETSGKLWNVFEDRVLIQPGSLVSVSAHAPYTVFTPYNNAWRKMSHNIPPPLARIRRLVSPKAPAGEIPSADSGQLRGGSLKFPSGGETAARKALRAFIDHRLGNYGTQRDFPGLDGTSRLSHHLSTGSLGVRTLYEAIHSKRASMARVQRNSADTFVDELVWREFYYEILRDFPYVVSGSFRQPFDRLEWPGRQGDLEAWKAGATGYPIVDAGMRQLKTEGWMHNRMRMIVASFLVKDLHIHWKSGEEHFMNHLADGDIALNNGGWQWSAGTGTDAQPWFRIFNPVSQSRKFDPEGHFVRRYIPELQNVPLRYLHAPWLMPGSIQQTVGCIIGKHYPKPIVDHDRERKKTIQLYSWVRGSGPA